MIKFILPLFIMILASSSALAEEPVGVCRDKPDGVGKDYYENGKIQTEWMCKNGKLNGITKLYYENGELEKASSYVNDARQGPTYGYYDSGSLKSVCNYKDGKRDGMHKIYD